MLNLKKLLTKITQTLGKSLIGTVSDVYWWSNSWTAPSDGMMVLRITPTNNSAWYWYINDSSISGISGVGTWSHQFRGADNNTVTYTIPVKKGATYSTALSSNLSTIKCLLYPAKVGGYCLTVFSRLSAILGRSFARLGVA